MEMQAGMDRRHDCEINLPYPKVTVNRPNRKYARILLKVYAGRTSEFTATSQYVYQNILLEEENPEVAAQILCIAVVEMRHMDMLGDVIRQLGELPRLGNYIGDSFVYWTAKNVYFNTVLKNILLKNISDEKKAIADYERAIALIDDPEIDALIKRIIMDEEKHIDIFSALYRKYV